MDKQLDGKMMRKDQKGRGALEIIEEAVHILRRNPLTLLPFYFIGSLPFVTAFLYFWADMSRSAFAGENCLTASLGLAMLFVWMKCWHAVFCGKVMDYITQQTSATWSFKRVLRLVSSQSIISCTGVIVLPVVLAIAVPFGWVYAFYQNISSEDIGKDVPLKDVVKRSWRLALLWPGQNHMLLLIMSAFSLFVFFNLCMIVYLLPLLLKKFFGIETTFALSSYSVFNTTFLSAACGLTYLCVDPLIKTIYALRCFYGASIKTGNDLMTDLLSSAKFRRGLSYVFILCFFYAVFMSAVVYGASGETAKPSSEKRSAVSSHELNSSIEKIMNEREFMWRVPKESLEKKEVKHSGLLDRFIAWAADKLRNLANFISKWWNKIKDWFKNSSPDNESA